MNIVAASLAAPSRRRQRCTHLRAPHTHDTSIPYVCLAGPHNIIKTAPMQRASRKWSPCTALPIADPGQSRQCSPRCAPTQRRRRRSRVALDNALPSNALDTHHRCIPKSFFNIFLPSQ